MANVTKGKVGRPSNESMKNPNDGFVSLLDGMNGGVSPFQVADAAYSRGVNVTTRGGLIRTRPGFVLEKTLGQGTFKGAKRWSLDGGEYIVYGLDTKIYVYSLESGAITEIAGSDMDAAQDTFFFTQADKWMIIQDGVSRPVVLQESTGTVSLYGRDAPDVCLVPGTIGEYVHSRIHYVPSIVPMQTPDPVASPDVVPDASTENGRVVFVSSDVRDNLDPEWLLRMSEHRVVNEGGAISLPQELGYIYGMSAFRNAATGTGVGALVVLGREGVCAFDVSVPRSQWKDVALGQVLFAGAGTKSPRSPIPVNDDLFYIDTEGHVRSMRYDKSQLGSGNTLSNRPISNEMSPYIKLSPREYLPYVSTALSDNRFLWTLVGESDHSFKALGSLDFAQVYSMFATDKPSYDGIWTGFKFLQVLQARKSEILRTFCVTKNDTAVVLVYLDEDTYTDLGTTNIESQLHTKYYWFGSAQLKQLRWVDMLVSDIKQTTTFVVYYRPAHYSEWSELDTKVINVPGSSQPQARRRVRFSLDITTAGCDPVSKEKLSNAYEFQFGIKWTGNCRIDRFTAQARLIDEPLPNNCATDNAEGEVYAVDTSLDEFSYEVSYE